MAKKGKLHELIDSQDTDGVRKYLGKVSKKNLETIVNMRPANGAFAGQSPLHVAAEAKNYVIFQQLAGMGADPNLCDSRGWTVLHTAAQAGDVDILRHLIRRDDIQTNAQTMDDSTALHYLCRSLNTWSARDLMDEFVRKNSAGIDQRNRSGETALHVAVFHANEMAVEVLLQHKANANVQTAKKFTPLHWAVRLKNERMVRLLLEHNADPTLAADDGSVPREMAVKMKLDRVEHLLKSAEELGSYLSELDLSDLVPTCRRHRITLEDFREGIINEEYVQSSGIIDSRVKTGLLKVSKNMLRQSALQRHNQGGYVTNGPTTLSMSVSNYKNYEPGELTESQLRLAELGLDVDFVLNAKDVEMEGALGKGFFGTVRKARWNGTEVAVKMITSSEFASDDSMGMFLKEVNILSKLRFKHVVQFFGVFTSLSDEFCIVSEFMERGSLADYYKHPDAETQLSLEKIHSFAEEIASGILYMHAKSPPILHRDLHPGNVLLDRYDTVKIADFGLSKEKAQATEADRSIGALQWMAPEVAMGREFTEAADVYSYACVLWSMFSRREPAENQDPLVYVTGVTKFADRPPLDHIAPAFLNLISMCWDQEPHKRPPIRWVVRYLRAMRETGRYDAAPSDLPEPESMAGRPIRSSSESSSSSARGAPVVTGAYLSGDLSSSDPPRQRSLSEKLTKQGEDDANNIFLQQSASAGAVPTSRASVVVYDTSSGGAKTKLSHSSSSSSSSFSSDDNY